MNWHNFLYGLFLGALGGFAATACNHYYARGARNRRREAYKSCLRTFSAIGRGDQSEALVNIVNALTWLEGGKVLSVEEYLARDEAERAALAHPDGAG